jgi:hypothetical protein
MKRILTVVTLVTLGLAAAALAQTTQPIVFAKGTPVVIVGEISSRPHAVAVVSRESRMQVDVGQDKTPFTLHIRSAQMNDIDGRKIAKSDLHTHWWVRAEGTVMDDARRIKVAKLQVLGKDGVAFSQSAAWRPDQSHGYIEAVAGTRQTYP